MRNLFSTFWKWTANRTRSGVSGAGLARLASGGLFKASTLSVLDQAVVSGTNFATSVIIGRSTGAPELGVYYLALTMVLFARGVQEQLVGAPYMIYCQGKSEHELKSYSGSALVHQIVLSAFVALVMGALWISGRLAGDLAAVVLVLVAALPLLLLREFAREMSFAHLRPAVALAIDSFVAAVQLGALAALGHFGMLTVPIAFWVMAGACGVAAAGWFLTKPQKMVATWAAAYRDWWSNWAFSRWALASQLLGQTTAYIMPWALAAAWDEAATGVFGACNTLVGLANMFVLGLSNYLSPRAARAYAQGGLSELKQVLGTIIALFVVSLGLFAVASFFLGEWVAVLMYSEKYGEALRGSGTIIGVLALGVVANSISMACGNGLWAMHRPAANFAADVCVMVAVVVGSVLLIPPLGPLGAAAATLLAHVTAASVRGWTLLRVMRDTGRQGGAA